jgi:hypothetical protein
VESDSRNISHRSDDRIVVTVGEEDQLRDAANEKIGLKGSSMGRRSNLLRYVYRAPAAIRDRRFHSIKI